TIVCCDWPTAFTWYKAVVNSLVPCDLCDLSQISHVVSNDVRSHILLTTLHVITDWPISDHTIGTSHRGPVRCSVLYCVQRTQRAPDHGTARSQGAQTSRGRGVIYKRPPDPALPRDGRWLRW
ncbi:unnamed protein product, partial [Staurois parvus]